MRKREGEREREREREREGERERGEREGGERGGGEEREREREREKGRERGERERRERGGGERGVTMFKYPFTDKSLPHLNDLYSCAKCAGLCHRPFHQPTPTDAVAISVQVDTSITSGRGNV